MAVRKKRVADTVLSDKEMVDFGWERCDTYQVLYSSIGFGLGESLPPYEDTVQIRNHIAQVFSKCDQVSGSFYNPKQFEACRLRQLH